MALVTRPAQDIDCRGGAVSIAHGGGPEQGTELPRLGYPLTQLLVLLWLLR